ncbi:hypothetical protein TRVL_07352 [Trypanosoma vivax]|nr:hypothetical protein TRVL_07352 [Trypanosoma vivax]
MGTAVPSTVLVHGVARRRDKIAGRTVRNSAEHQKRASKRHDTAHPRPMLRLFRLHCPPVAWRSHPVIEARAPLFADAPQRGVNMPYLLLLRWWSTKRERRG